MPVDVHMLKASKGMAARLFRKVGEAIQIHSTLRYASQTCGCCVFPRGLRSRRASLVRHTTLPTCDVHVDTYTTQVANRRC